MYNFYIKFFVEKISKTKIFPNSQVTRQRELDRVKYENIFKRNIYLDNFQFIKTILLNQIRINLL